MQCHVQNVGKLSKTWPVNLNSSLKLVNIWFVVTGICGCANG